MRIRTKTLSKIVDNRTLCDIVDALSDITPSDSEFKPEYQSDVRDIEEHIRSLKERVASKGAKDSASYESLIRVQKEEIEYILNKHENVIDRFDGILEISLKTMVKEGDSFDSDFAKANNISFKHFPNDFECVNIGYTVQAKCLSVLFNMRAGLEYRRIRCNLIFK